MSGVPVIETENSDCFKRINVAGFFGGIGASGLEATVYSERRDMLKALETEPISPNRLAIKRVVECELLISPITMKTTYDWLGKKIEEYEKLFGRIRSPEEIQSSQGRSDDQ